MRIKVCGVTGELASASPWYEHGMTDIGVEYPIKVSGYREVEVLESDGKVTKLYGVRADEIETIL